MFTFPKSSRPAPLILAIAVAFILSYFFAPGQNLLSSVVGASALQSLAPANRQIALAMAGYWLPSVLIYFALRMSPLCDALKVTGWEAVVLAVADAVLVAYVGARIAASMVQGASAAVASFAPLTALPALFIAGVIVFNVVVRCIRRTGPTGKVAASVRGMSATGAALFGVIALAPPALVLGPLLIAA